MAQSNDEMRNRIDRIEAAIVHMTDVLVLQSERMDFGFQSFRDETRAMRETLTDRLDRLIAIATKERTVSIERLASIEARLSQLEGRLGL